MRSYWRLLSTEDKQTVSRARKIKRFLTQPYHVAEVFTGQKGVFVPLSETRRGFKGLLSDEYDDIPEQAFLYCGSIDEVLNKAKSL